MKTTIARTAALIALVLSGIFATSLRAENKYVTNEEVKDNKVVSRTIYINNGYLQPHLKYDYAYDQQARMTQKTAYKWDDRKKEWAPDNQMKYSYNANQVMVEYGKWNRKEQAYSLDKEITYYEISEQNMPVAYQNFQWNPKANEWRSTQNIAYNRSGFILADN